MSTKIYDGYRLLLSDTPNAFFRFVDKLRFVMEEVYETLAADLMGRLAVELADAYLRGEQMALFGPGEERWEPSSRPLSTAMWMIDRVKPQAGHFQPSQLLDKQVDGRCHRA